VCAVGFERASQKPRSGGRWKYFSLSLLGGLAPLFSARQKNGDGVRADLKIGKRAFCRSRMDFVLAAAVKVVNQYSLI